MSFELFSFSLLEITFDAKTFSSKKEFLGIFKNRTTSGSVAWKEATKLFTFLIVHYTYYLNSKALKGGILGKRLMNFSCGAVWRECSANRAKRSIKRVKLLWKIRKMYYKKFVDESNDTCESLWFLKRNPVSDKKWLKKNSQNKDDWTPLKKFQRQYGAENKIHHPSLTNQPHLISIVK